MKDHPALRTACFPSPAQELLIRAAVRADDAAIHAWEHWKRDAGNQPLDTGSERILPLVHHNLLRLGIDDPPLREAYGRACDANELLLVATRPLLRQLQEAGVRTMLLKGAALTMLVYRDPGVRVMHDIDVLVPRGDGATALRVACERGWTTEQPLPLLNEPYVARHGIHFRGTGNVALDLHWEMFLDSARGTEADAEVWNGCKAIAFQDGTATAVPAAADLLFHVCVHGLRWSRISPIRWVTDALAILGQPDLAIDWSRFLHQGKLRRLILPLREAVDYLCDAFAAPVPADVRQQLRATRPSRREQIEYDLFLRGTPALGAAQMALFHGLRYARLSEGAGIGRRLTGFPEYLRHHWNTRRTSHLPGIVLRKSLARLRSQGRV